MWAEKEGGKGGSGGEGAKTAGLGEGKREIVVESEQVGGGGR